MPPLVVARRQSTRFVQENNRPIPISCQNIFLLYRIHCRNASRLGRNDARDCRFRGPGSGYRGAPAAAVAISWRLRMTQPQSEDFVGWAKRGLVRACPPPRRPRGHGARRVRLCPPYACCNSPAGGCNHLASAIAPEETPIVHRSRERKCGSKGATVARTPISYSITSSAMASSCGGTSIPSVLPVCRLMTNSNLVGRITGSSEGFSPLRMRPV
jgi:hypothetical protein